MLSNSSIELYRVGLLLLGLALLPSCTATEAQSEKQREKTPIPVVVATATQKTVPLQVRTTGTIQAYATVSVTSQIAGQLTAVHFQEGQEVKQGDLLFSIDPRPLQATLAQSIANREKTMAQVSQAQAALLQAQAQVSQAQANLAKDLAQAKNATVQAQRYTGLLHEGAVSQEQADQFRTESEAQGAVVSADRSSIRNAQAAVQSAGADLKAAQSAVSAARAEVEQARVQLSYTAINSPINGRTGALKVNRGNLIKENDTNPLVVISQIRPIYVTFSIPQRLLGDLKKYRSQGSVEVVVTLPKEGGKPVRGQLIFVDSGVDPSTGTIQLKGRFPNSDGRLTPGQFVSVALKLTEQPDAIVVPSTAIGTSQQGSFVYVVRPEQTVEMRPVTTGESVGDRTVIKNGLQPGERVVTDGQFNLTPDAKVQVKQGTFNR